MLFLTEVRVHIKAFPPKSIHPTSNICPSSNIHPSIIQFSDDSGGIFLKIKTDFLSFFVNLSILFSHLD